MTNEQVVKIMESLSESQDQQIQDKALGCIIGALLGDATGTYLEFSNKVIDEKSVAKALTLPGGGPHKTAPGQISDDGELTISLNRSLIYTRLYLLSLMQGLIKGKGILNMKEIVKMYGKWIQSKPFDIGATTRAAFFKCDINNPNPERVIRKATEGKSATSQSNGGLMRLTAQAVWGRNLSDEDLITAAKLQTSLSHSNQVALEASAVYCLAIKKILQGELSREQVYEEVKAVARSSGFSKDLLDWFSYIDSFEAHKFPEDFTPKKAGGWLRHALILSFHCLRYNLSYEESIRTTLLVGGDTDTNACIVGGMIGACEGLAKLPQDKVEIMLNCDISKGSQKNRPKFLQTRNGLIEQIKELLSISPNQLSIIM